MKNCHVEKFYNGFFFVSKGPNFNSSTPYDPTEASPSNLAQVVNSSFSLNYRGANVGSFAPLRVKQR